jgi:hypothetical protein
MADFAALERQLDEEGYLFFRSVLDIGAVERVRTAMTGVLERFGLVEPDSTMPESTGDPTVPRGAEIVTAAILNAEYHRLRLWQQFVDVPQNRAFFELIAGGPVDFAPITEYRSRAPNSGQIYWHQDGYYLQHFQLRTAWIPVMDIDEQMGGIAIASGLHRSGFLHDAGRDTILPIPTARIPDDLYRRSEYHPGDVLIFGEYTPHTGLPNRTTSNLYRLSFDVRFHRAGDRAYDQGELIEIGDSWIVVRSDRGVVRRVEIPRDLVIRAKSGATLAGARLSSWDVAKGEFVMVSCCGDRATYLRPIILESP